MDSFKNYSGNSFFKSTTICFSETPSSVAPQILAEILRKFLLKNYLLEYLQKFMKELWTSARDFYEVFPETAHKILEAVLKWNVKEFFGNVQRNFLNLSWCCLLEILRINYWNCFWGIPGQKFLLLFLILFLEELLKEYQGELLKKFHEIPPLFLRNNMRSFWRSSRGNSNEIFFEKYSMS